MHGPSNRSIYRFIQNCACQPKVLRTIEKPWTELTLQDICNEFRFLKETLLVEHNSLKGFPITKESIRLSNDFKNPYIDQTSLNKSRIKEEQTDEFLKWFGLFLVPLIFIVILSWLLFVLFQ